MCVDVSMLCIINSFQKRTLTNGLATIADIGGPKSCHTDFFKEVCAIRITGLTELTVAI
ncbi:hypothetical protein LBYZC6_18250 [Lacrimispora brassicae]